MRQELVATSQAWPPPRGRHVTAADLAAAPVVLTIEDVARIFRLSPTTIRARLRAGEFVEPMERRRPFLWRLEDVALAVQRKRTEPADDAPPAPARKRRPRRKP